MQSTIAAAQWGYSPQPQMGYGALQPLGYGATHGATGYAAATPVLISYPTYAPGTAVSLVHVPGGPPLLTSAVSSPTSATPYYSGPSYSGVILPRGRLPDNMLWVYSHA